MFDAYDDRRCADCIHAKYKETFNSGHRMYVCGKHRAAASYIRAQDAEEMAAMIWDALEENRECDLPFPDYKLRFAYGGMLFDSRKSLEGLLGKTLTEE